MCFRGGRHIVVVSELLREVSLSPLNVLLPVLVWRTKCVVLQGVRYTHRSNFLHALIVSQPVSA